MMQALFKSKIVIGAVIVLVLMVGGYFAIKSAGSKQPVSGVKKQAVTQTASGADGSAGPGQEFVAQLLAIQNITLNVNLFADPVFTSLEDFSREILDQPISRPNPFAPIDLRGVETGTAAQNAGVQTQTPATTGKTTSKTTGAGALFQAQ
jgi:hypothetical protein